MDDYMDDYYGRYCCRDCEHCYWDNYEKEYYCDVIDDFVDLDDPACYEFL